VFVSLIASVFLSFWAASVRPSPGLSPRRQNSQAEFPVAERGPRCDASGVARRKQSADRSRKRAAGSNRPTPDTAFPVELKEASAPRRLPASRKPPSPAQIAARERFAARAANGDFRRKRKVKSPYLERNVDRGGRIVERQLSPSDAKRWIDDAPNVEDGHRRLLNVALPSQFPFMWGDTLPAQLSTPAGGMGAAALVVGGNQRAFTAGYPERDIPNTTAIFRERAWSQLRKQPTRGSGPRMVSSQLMGIEEAAGANTKAFTAGLAIAGNNRAFAVHSGPGRRYKTSDWVSRHAERDEFGTRPSLFQLRAWQYADIPPQSGLLVSKRQRSKFPTKPDIDGVRAPVGPAMTGRQLQQASPMPNFALQ